jgi:peptide/nickel transport system permease protein
VSTATSTASERVGTITVERDARPRRALQRFLGNRRAVVGAVMLLVLVVITIRPDLVTTRSPNATAITNAKQAPSAEHPFGTDVVGRDYLARIVHGGRISLLVGVCAMLVSIVVGTLVGSVAGYFGGRTDELLSRLVDLMLSLPIFYIMIVVFMLLRPGIPGLIVMIGLASWMPAARLVRGLVLVAREQDYVQAAHALGAGHLRTVFLHVLPNIVGPIIVTASFRVGDAILLESALSFLGVGIQPPQATWGNMIVGAQAHLFTAPWIGIFPGVMITLTVMAFMFVGDGLRDAFDAKWVDRSGRKAP